MRCLVLTATMASWTILSLSIVGCNDDLVSSPTGIGMAAGSGESPDGAAPLPPSPPPPGNAPPTSSSEGGPSCEVPEEQFFEVEAPFESREQLCALFGDFIFTAPFPPGTEGGFYVSRCGLGYQVSIIPVVGRCPGNDLRVEELTACICGQESPRDR